jgi:hypothetical protein
MEPIQLPPVKQIGMVVRDAEKTAQFMERVFGFGPFALMEIVLKDYKLRGTTRGECVLKVALGNSANTEIELIQVLRGDENPYSEFLQQHGEGIHHVRLDIPMDGTSLEDQLSHFAAFDVEPLLEATVRIEQPEVGTLEIDVAYVDATEQCGLIVEVSGVPRMLQV